MNRRNLLSVAALVPAALLFHARGEGKPIPPPAPKKPDPPVPEPEFLPSAVIQVKNPFLMRFRWATLDKWVADVPATRNQAEMICTRIDDPLRGPVLYATYRPCGACGQGEEYLLLHFSLNGSDYAVSVINAFGLEYVGSSHNNQCHIFRRSDTTNHVLAEKGNTAVFEACRDFNPSEGRGVTMLLGYESVITP